VLDALPIRRFDDDSMHQRTAPVRCKDNRRIGLPGGKDVQVVMNSVGRCTARDAQDDLTFVPAIRQRLPVIQHRGHGKV